MRPIEDRVKVCRYYRSPAMHESCEKGRVYDEVNRRDELGSTGCMLRMPCLGDTQGSVVRGQTIEPCDLHEPHTREEIEAEDKAFQRAMELMKQGLSSCCEAPIDTSHVIPDGKHKNHGPRYCSECGRLAYMV